VSLRVLAVGLAALVAVRAQRASPPQFEVASIKRAPQTPRGDVFSTKPDVSRGRIRWTSELDYLIAYAYQLDLSRLSSCINCGRIYSVEAIFDPEADDEQVRLMLQSLLADRFKLRTHLVSTEADGFALVLAKGGPKIKAADPKEGVSYAFATLPEAGIVAITGRGASIPQLVAALQRVVNGPVWDKTGLSGKFDFEFRYAAFTDAGLEAGAPSLGTALQENLGLKLERQRGPVETLVVDHVEEPSEN
jgi:uncharacterized protein (TIGR03435 family)